jgi:hypothetical protein
MNQPQIVLIFSPLNLCNLYNLWFKIFLRSRRKFGL